MSSSFTVLKNFDATEKKSLILYISGLVIYKFVLETMNTCLNGIVINRLTSNQGSTWAQMQGLNLGMQILGSLLVAPLMKRIHSIQILRKTILILAVICASVPVLEVVSGGRIPASSGSKSPLFWGSWSPMIIYAIYALIGIGSGVVETLRRVIPSDIVGSEASKLLVMDSTVHIFWEIFGTVGSLFSYIWIGYFGWGFAFTVLPIGFIIASSIMHLISYREDKIQEIESYKLLHKDSTYKENFVDAVTSFIHSIILGARLILTQRSLFWLLPAYTLPLIMHRYLENTIFPFYAKSNLKSSDYQAILNGGSNFGEMAGAILVFLVGSRVKTPIPYLRLDVLMLLLVWIFPFYSVGSDALAATWLLAPIAALISFGWSAGDVSLIAYIQSKLSKLSLADAKTSPLGAVMSFLYVSNVLIYYFMNLSMSLVRDDYTKNNKSLTDLYIWIGGVFMTVCGLVTLIATFIPKGSFVLNPKPEDIDIDDGFTEKQKISDVEAVKA